jgi:anti-sigma factor RsiW
MNSPGSPDLPGPWPDVLAAYTDGELDPPARAAVERWLSAHPGALAELRAQRQFSPENWRLWQKAEPPLPTEDTWAAVRNAIGQAVTAPVATPAPRPEPGRWKWAGRTFAGGVAAAVVAIIALGPVFFPPRPQEPVGPVAEPADDPLRDYVVLPIADEADVDVWRVAGPGDGGLTVGAHPLPGVLVLADEGDVELEGAEDHPAWPGGPQITRWPGDTPMLYASNPR